VSFGVLHLTTEHPPEPCAPFLQAALPYGSNQVEHLQELTFLRRIAFDDIAACFNTE
jgi:hypothetical protein